MSKDLSGDTYVYQIAREKKQLSGCLYTVLSPFLRIKDIPFGLGGGWDL
jgi:hypothetical protein